MDWTEFCYHSRIDKKLRDVKLLPSKYINQNLLNMGTSWSNKPHNLYLSGITGSGKTSYMIALCRAIIEKDLFKYGVFTRYKRSVELFSEILAAPDNNTSQEQVLRLYQEPNFLFLDDVGSETWSERIERNLYSLIDHRYNNDLITIITSNLTLLELKQRAGTRIASRLANFTEIQFPEIDWREKLVE